MIFSGAEDSNELSEVKFLAHLLIKKLHDVLLPEPEGGVSDECLNEDKNADAFATLIHCLDDRSLSLIIRKTNKSRTATMSLGSKLHYGI